MVALGIILSSPGTGGIPHDTQSASFKLRSVSDLPQVSLSSLSSLSLKKQGRPIFFWTPCIQHQKSTVNINSNDSLVESDCVFSSRNIL